MWDKMIRRRRKPGSVPVYLNVYDLTPINGYAYWVGLGVYHSGVEVHGVEYAFGAHDHPTSGIFEVEPRQCPGFTFRKRILIGRTDLHAKEVCVLMKKLAEEYFGNSYNLITRNCNHFCKDASLRLTGKPIPRWVNRLARLGLFCNCVLPAGLSETKVQQVRGDGRVEEEKEDDSGGGTGTNARPPISSCPSSSKVRENRQRHCFPLSLSLASRSTSL